MKKWLAFVLVLALLGCTSGIAEGLSGVPEGTDGSVIAEEAEAIDASVDEIDPYMYPFPEDDTELPTEEPVGSMPFGDATDSINARRTFKEAHPDIEVVTVTTTAKFRNVYYGALYDAIKERKQPFRIMTITTGNDVDSIYPTSKIRFSRIPLIIVLKGNVDHISVSGLGFVPKFLKWAMKKAKSEDDSLMQYRLSCGILLGWSGGTLGDSGTDHDGNRYHYMIDDLHWRQETEKQEKAVDTKVAEILTSLNLKGKSDYDKVRAIHDYILRTLSYELESRSLIYDALVKKRPVRCVGYAASVYRLLNKAGVPCEIITGSGHAWNIVKMGEKWYHLDATFDDTGSSKYAFFLVGSERVNKDGRHHYSISELAWLKSYKISKENYR